MHRSIALLIISALILTSYIIAVKPSFCFTSSAENSWASKAPMEQARGGLGVAVVNGKIYAIGGSAENVFDSPLSSWGNWGIVSTNEEYDPATNNWTTKASMPTSRVYIATAVYNNKIYCFGGITGIGKVPYEVLCRMTDIYPCVMF